MRTDLSSLLWKHIDFDDTTNLNATFVGEQSKKFEVRVIKRHAINTRIARIAWT